MRHTSSKILKPERARPFALFRQPHDGVSRVRLSFTGSCAWPAALTRQCLGTPIQNSLEDIFSLLHFLQVKNFEDTWW